MLPLIANDKVQTVIDVLATPPYTFLAGLKYDALGRLVVTSTEPVSNYQNGLPMAADGSLCVSSL